MQKGQKNKDIMNISDDDLHEMLAKLHDCNKRASLAAINDKKGDGEDIARREFHIKNFGFDPKDSVCSYGRDKREYSCHRPRNLSDRNIDLHYL